MARGLRPYYHRLRPLRRRCLTTLAADALLKGVALSEGGNRAATHWLIWDYVQQKVIDPHEAGLPVRLTSYVLVRRPQ